MKISTGLLLIMFYLKITNQIDYSWLTIISPVLIEHFLAVFVRNTKEGKKQIKASKTRYYKIIKEDE